MANQIASAAQGATLPLHTRFLLPLIASWWFAACSDMSPREAPVAARTASGPEQLPVYVIRRGWHVDVGLAVRDLQPPLQQISSAFPASRYLLFGFGDRHYLLHRDAGNLLAALWAGPGIVLVTSLRSRQPADAFGQDSVIQLALTVQQMRDLQSFIWYTLGAHDSITTLAGPYPESAYYESAFRYSAVYTCNTWAADALRSARLPVDSFGVAFSWQLWHQVQRAHDQGTPSAVAAQP